MSIACLDPGTVLHVTPRSRRAEVAAGRGYHAGMDGDQSIGENTAVAHPGAVSNSPRPALPRWPLYAAGMMVLLAVLLAASMTIEVPYYAFSPGPVHEVDEMVVFDEPDPLTGEFYMLTVELSEVRALEYAVAWFDPTVDLYAREAIRSSDEDDEQYQERNRRSMDESKNVAIYVATQKIGYEGPVEGAGVYVSGISEGSPVIGILEVDDLITAVDGVPVATAPDFIEIITGHAIGDELELSILRAGEELTLSVTLVPHVDDASRPMVGVLAATANPFGIDIADGNIGGPSAGLMYTLTIMDLLSEDDLSKGRVIAGTGTMSEDEKVGSIGGIRQKVVAATEAGAEYILVPAGNYEDALTVETDVELVEVATLDDALEFLAALPPLEQ